MRQGRAAVESLSQSKGALETGSGVLLPAVPLMQGQWGPPELFFKYVLKKKAQAHSKRGHTPVAFYLLTKPTKEVVFKSHKT